MLEEGLTEFVASDNRTEILNNAEMISNFRFPYQKHLYHLLITTIATIDQLFMISDSDRRTVRSELNYCEKSGLVTRNTISYKGSNVDCYSLTRKGKYKLSECINMNKYVSKSYKYAYQKIHFIEIGDLYFNIFRRSKALSFEREVEKKIKGNIFLRTDADISIKYKNITETFSIEHDTSKASKGKLLEKLNDKYALYLDNKSTNLVYTISKEDLVNKQRIDRVNNSDELKKISHDKSILTKTRSSMLNNSIDSVEEFVSQFKDNFFIQEAIKKDKYKKMYDNEQNILDFIQYNYDTGFTHSDELLAKIVELESLKSIRYSKLISKELEKNEIKRVEAIKKYVRDIGEYVEIERKYFLKHSSLLLNKVKTSGDKILMKSFMSALYTNEMIIGPLSIINDYFSNRTEYMKNPARLYTKVFGAIVDEESLTYESVSFSCGDIEVIKNINCCVVEQDGVRIALVILEPRYNFADELKYEIIKEKGVKHKYDHMLIAVTDNFMEETKEKIQF